MYKKCCHCIGIYLVYLFIYYQEHHLAALNLQKTIGILPNRKYDWLSWVKKGGPRDSFYKYVLEFMYKAYSIIKGEEPKMMPTEMRPCL